MNNTQAHYKESSSSDVQKNHIALSVLQQIANPADVYINGTRPWDIQMHNPLTAQRILAQGSLGLGESYIEGWWDCERLDQLFEKILSGHLDENVDKKITWYALKTRIFNLQNMRRSWQVGQLHYDLGNDFFENMLGKTMAYTCAYWQGLDKDRDHLDQAQNAKLELICRKLKLSKGMRLLDIGCGWGSLMRYAAEHYQVECVGITVSKEQAEYAKKISNTAALNYQLIDYRELSVEKHGYFDRIASVGMFEHVGHRNYREFFQVARKLLKQDGFFLLHTIGRNENKKPTDPWIVKYIFPNGELPTLTDIARYSEDQFVVEDIENIGINYDITLMAWWRNFEDHWVKFSADYGERFYRMWRYYLLCCAGTFRARTTQVWQLVLSPSGIKGGYVRPNKTNFYIV